MSDHPRGVFFDEWQACLRAHYQHVIATGDTITQATLRGVLLRAGLTPDELDALATAHPPTLAADGDHGPAADGDHGPA